VNSIASMPVASKPANARLAVPARIARRALSLRASGARRHSPRSVSSLVRLKADPQARAGDVLRIFHAARQWPETF
jgi:hypothetical protein